MLVFTVSDAIVHNLRRISQGKSIHSTVTSKGCVKILQLIGRETFAVSIEVFPLQKFIGRTFCRKRIISVKVNLYVSEPCFTKCKLKKEWAGH